MVSIARKLSTIEERRQEPNCLFRRGDYRNKGHKPEKLLGSSLGEEGFRYNNNNYYYFYDIQRYVSNDQACGKLLGNKD
jgi:hypothetical protein